MNAESRQRVTVFLQDYCIRSWIIHPHDESNCNYGPMIDL